VTAIAEIQLKELNMNIILRVVGYLPVVAFVFLSCGLVAPSRSDEPVNLEVGSKAPVFEGIDQNGKPWKSSDVVGKKLLVVYFYPAAHTGGCTKQACAFRDAKAELAEHDIEVVGVSGDEPKNLLLFEKDQHLNFTLLADFDGSIAKKFGVPLTDGGQIEREFDGTPYVLKRGVTAKRWTFVVDKQGKIIWKDTQVKAAEDSKSVLAVVAKQAATQ
jgi:peroxiredoxin Q/BCP